MDSKTIDYYNSNASELQLKYNSVSPEYLKLFKAYFDPETSVLDIGCGSVPLVLDPNMRIYPTL